MKSHATASFAPDGTYTRNSEGSFLRMKDGSILFAFSRFVHSQNDAAPCDIVAVISKDEGETWSEPRVLIPAAIHGAANVMSVSLFRMANGDVGVFYLVKQTPYSNRIMLARSVDECETFYKYVQCSLDDREGYYVINNDRVCRTRSGRLILPLAFHRGGHNEDGTAFLEGCSYLCFLISDDDGETWTEAPDKVFPPFTNSRTGLQEPGLIAKRNGILWGYARTDKMYQYEYFSFDDGMHWTQAQPSRFTAPDSPMKIARNEANGLMAAVWNPVPKYNGRYISKGGWGRTPLVYALSEDDGLTWGECVTIEEDPEHGYCYPAILFLNRDEMLISYCAGGPEDGVCLSRTTIRKICLR